MARLRPARYIGGMRILALMLVAVLAACAAPPPPVAVLAPPLPYPPSVRARMVAVAEAEWREWGSLVREVGDPAPQESPEARLENFPRVLAYWLVAPDEDGAIRRNRDLYGAALAGEPRGAGLWRNPAWSAAFISYVMQRAGVDAREFRPTASHAFYLDHILKDAADYPDQAPFIPHLPDIYAPAVGDLVCADRSRDPISRWTQRAADQGHFRPMHCDLVVAVAPGVVEAIGGNVADAVTRTRFPTDAQGRLLPNPAGGAVWFGVFENRLGRLGPWSSPGALQGRPAA